MKSSDFENGSGLDVADRGREEIEGKTPHYPVIALLKLYKT